MLHSNFIAIRRNMFQFLSKSSTFFEKVHCKSHPCAANHFTRLHERKYRITQFTMQEKHGSIHGNTYESIQRRINCGIHRSTPSSIYECKHIQSPSYSHRLSLKKNLTSSQVRFASVYSRHKASTVIRPPAPEALQEDAPLIPMPASSQDSGILPHDASRNASGAGAFRAMNLEPFRRSEMRITGRRSTGFTINNTYITLGSICIFKKGGYVLWKESHHSQLTIDSFKILEYLNPTPKIVVLGMGDEAYKLDPKIRNYYETNLGVTFEVLTSKQAVGVWNVLSGEDREVVGFLMTERPVNQDKMHPAHNKKFQEQLLTLLHTG